MSIQFNPIRQRLMAGDSLIGSWLCTGSSVAAELMASCGYAFMAVDAEHSAVGLAETHHLFQAIRSGNPDCASLVRLHGVDYSQVKRYLDAGADGVIAPMVNTREQAEILVDAVKYPPLGSRGLGFCRGNTYGIHIQEAFDQSNTHTLTCVQIEHVDAVDAIDGILSVEGVDAAFVGPFDLSASMGIPGQFDHPQIKAALKTILDACNKHQVVPGIHVVAPKPEEVVDRIQEGFRFIAYSLDITLILESSRQGLASIEKQLALRL